VPATGSNGEAAPSDADALASSSNSRSEAEAAVRAYVEDEGATRVKVLLDSQLDRLLFNCEHDLEVTDRAIGSKLKRLDLDRDGLISASEMHQAVKQILAGRDTDEAAAAIVKQLDMDHDGIITVDDVRRFARLRAAAEAALFQEAAASDSEGKDGAEGGLDGKTV